ncbi:MAG: Hpt domain-containing protein [Coleofasciculaceae cyanobacterium]
MMIEDEELRNLYKFSSEERLEKLQEGWLHLQQHPDDESALENLQWEAHSLRGDSRILGIEDVEDLSNQIEDIFGCLQDKPIVLTEQIVGSISQGINAINLLVQEAVTGQNRGVDTVQTIELLSELLSRLQNHQEEFEPKKKILTADTSSISSIEDEELRDIYLATSKEHLRKLEAGLLHLQDQPNDESILEELQREAHSLKGDSRSVGIETIENLSHTFEEIFRGIKNQELSFSDSLSINLYQGLNTINLLVEQAVIGQVSEVDTNQVLEKLLKATSDSQQQFNRVENNLEQISNSFIEDEALQDIYLKTSKEHLRKLEAGLLHLQDQPNDESILEELQREAHSLKGDSRSVGIEHIETLSHALEEVFASVINQETILNQRLFAPLSQILNAIDLLLEEVLSGQDSGVDTDQVLEPLLIAISESPQPETVLIPSYTTPQIQISQIEDQELRDIYLVTSQERLQKLGTGLLHLEKHPQDLTVLEDLLRELHSLKGDSRSTGIEQVENLSHALEETLGQIQKQEVVLSPQLFDNLYQGLDSISLLVREAGTGQTSGVNTTQVLKQLSTVTSQPQEQLASPSVDIPSLPAEIPLIATPEKSPLSLGVGESDSIETIRVSTRHLDALVKQAEELTVTKISIAQAATEIREMVNLWEERQAFHRQRRYSNSSTVAQVDPYEERLGKMIEFLSNLTQENSTKLDSIAEDLGDRIRTLRLLPLSTLFKLFPRMVRDLSRQQAKEVELVVEGGETNADKRIIEEIKDSLMHIIRNSIDHGIETTAEREKLGKPSVATIQLKGYKKGNSIIIEITDDGRGLDVEKIKQTALRRGIYQQEELEAMNPRQIHSLIFVAGFSTRSFITEISGRGIGLDVVRTQVERLRGDIEVESVPSQGCTFRLQLGTNLATINVLLLEVQGVVHALPIEFLQRTLLISQKQIITKGGQKNVDLYGEVIPIADLAEVLELDKSPAFNFNTQVERLKSDTQPCIFLQVGEEVSGFLVDKLLDTQEVVLKPQSQLLKRVRNVSGATILSTGKVCMMLNPLDLLRTSNQQNSSTVPTKNQQADDRKRKILLVEDSILVRTQEQRLLEKAGYEVVVAVDGLDGYNKLKSSNFDGVLSDVEMPNLDGFSLTAKIRQHQEYAELPIVLVTTLASDQDKRKGADAGASAYIIKGKFNQDVLLEVLGRLV